MSVTDYLSLRVGSPLIADALITASERYGIDPALLVALCWQESRFRIDATSINVNKSVDRGLMQLNSSTFPNLREKDFFDPYLNAEQGASYLSKLMKMSGNTVTALAMYNAGPGRVGSFGAPRRTLEYIDSIMDFRAQLVRGYINEYSNGGVLVSRDMKPVKNPDLL